MDVREAAFISLLRTDKQDKFVNLELDSAIKKYGFTGSDRALFTYLVYGVTEKQITLDYYIDKFSSIPLDKLEDKVKIVLRLGFFQLLYSDSIPARAAVNESVELAKLRLHRGTSGFINAVLRAYLRGKDSVSLPDKDKTPADYLSVKYSFPLWLTQKWMAEYGFDGCEALMREMSVPPTITLRTNTLRISREELLERLSSLGISAAPTAMSKTGIALKDYVPLSDITPLSEGLCFVSDEASQLCASALSMKPGELLIDACACPGGKSFSAAMMMENRGCIDAFDLHESKLPLRGAGAEQLGRPVLHPWVRMGGVYESALDNRADAVLCDVPCSGLGVIAKKPDLRRKTPEQIERLPEIQYSILEVNSRYVKPGGRIVYSTCTLNPAENEAVFDRFLRENPDFEPDRTDMPGDKYEITLLPHIHHTDGFFIAKARKKPAH